MESSIKDSMIQDLQNNKSQMQLPLTEINILRDNEYKSLLYEKNCQDIFNKICKLDIDSISPLI